MLLTFSQSFRAESIEGMEERGNNTRELRIGQLKP